LGRLHLCRQDQPNHQSRSPDFRVEHEVPAVAGRASAMTAAASNMLKANASRFVKVFSFNSVCPARYCAGHEWLISATP